MKRDHGTNEIDGKYGRSPSFSVCSVFFVCSVIFFLLAPARIYAHPAPFSYLDLRLGRERLVGALTVHVIDLAHDLNITTPDSLLEPAFAQSKREAIQSLLHPRLTLAADGEPLAFEIERIEPQADRQALTLHLRFHKQTFPGSVKIQCALFPYDPQHQTFLNIYEEEELVRQEIFDKDRASLEHFTGGRQGTMAVVKAFLQSGVYHIFAGPDHVLFIVGLLLLGGTLMRLLAIVTAFTLAHSITLTLAALEIVTLPSHLVEPAIALSIIYVGLDNLMVGKTSRDLRAWTAFFFGLVHGFGFAGVLAEFGLPRQALGWSLFSFNLGVEIGQACIVVVVAALLAALRGRKPELARRVMIFGSVCVIVAGVYWFIQRVFFSS